MPKQDVTFGLVHGSWHGAWCWEPLQTELSELGYHSVAMDLPIDDPTATFDDYAEAVINHLRGKTNIALVGHSRAGNVIPRVAGRLAIDQLIYLAASFEPATICHPANEERTLVPPRNSEQFLRGITQHNDGLTTFDKQLAKQLFYGECSPEIQEWAVNRLRPQRRTADEPALVTWPDIPQQTIVCSRDLVVNPAWSRYAAQNWLQLKPIVFESDHSPFLSRPRALAQLLIDLCKA